MGTEILFHEYVRPVRVNSQSAITLHSRLEKAAPPDLFADEKKAMKAMQQRAQSVLLIQNERDRLAPAKLRPLLAAYGSDWTALKDALGATGSISDVSESVERARELATSLFPDGVSFAYTEADQAWVEGMRRIERIDSEGLAQEIEAIVGKRVLASVRKSTEKLADALGTGREPRVVASTTALQAELLLFARAVSAYVRMLAAHCDEDDPASVARFLSAVAPIDKHRAAMRGRGESDVEPDPTVVDPDPTPSDPTPAPPVA